jgi:hypothetical protein
MLNLDLSGLYSCFLVNIYLALNIMLVEEFMRF